MLNARNFSATYYTSREVWVQLFLGTELGLRANCKVPQGSDMPRAPWSSFLFCLFVCYQFYQFFSCLLICLFLTLFSFERTVLKVSVLTAQGSEGSYDEDSRWAGGQVPCLHMAGECASADYL